MHIEEEIKGEIAILRLRGDLLDEDAEQLLLAKVTSLASDDITKVVIDLGRVNRINSQGLSALISAVKTVRSKGGEVRLAQIDRQIRDVFVRTKLVRVFPTYETVDRALASYANWAG